MPLLFRTTVFFVLLVPAIMAMVSDSDSGRPMGKVVKVLQAMAAQLEKEQDEDEEIYDAYACWCESNDKAKTTAIADAEQHSLDLEASIQELTGTTAALTVKVDNLAKEIEETENALAKAAAVRQKEAGEFHQGEKDSIEGIEGLKNAVQVLSGHHGDSVNFAQTLMQVRQLIKNTVGLGARRKLEFAPAQRRVLASLIQQPAGYASSTNAPKSGEIYGVLKSMKESFETSYETAKSDEGQSQDAYGGLTSAKTKGLNAAKEQHQTKSSELADATESLASDRTDLKDTSEQLEADRYFLNDLKKRCAAMDDEWANRSKVRMLEQKAVGEAIGILNSDDARDTAQRTQGAASFLQSAAASSKFDEASSTASKVLADAAKRLNKPQLAALSVSVKADVFGAMKESMDKMVDTLKLDQANEVKEKDLCRNQLHDNAFEMESRYRDKKDLEVKIADLEELKQRLTKEIKEATDEMLQTRVEMKRAAENRKKQNQEFMQVVGDQRATQDLLQQALKKLKNFYSKVSIRDAELVQKQQSVSPVGEAAPKAFTPYKKAGGAGGVMSVIRDIISESEMEETEATKSEQVAQEAYEQLIADSNAEVKALLEKIADMTEQLAQCDADLTQANADLLALGKILEDLNQDKTDIDFRCHHVLKNFEDRQAARTEEIDALLAAKAIMSQARG